MEANLRWIFVTAIAPIAWGANYYVTRQFLPSGIPLYGAALRALPAGLLLLALTRQLPHGHWWWRSAVLGVLNIGAFFVLVYVAAQSLPSSVASTLMALSAAVMMVFAWAGLGERPRVLGLAGAAIGFLGVCVMLLADPGAVSLRGVLASVAAMIMSSAGFVLAKRWNDGVGVLALTAWQLIAGGLLLVPVAILTEGPFPRFGGAGLAGLAYTTIIATALGYVAWFAGLRRLPAGVVGLVGLLNPLAGVLLGALVAGEAFGARQVFGTILVLVGVTIGQQRVGVILGRWARSWRPTRVALSSAASTTRRSDERRSRRQSQADVAHPARG